MLIGSSFGIETNPPFLKQNQIPLRVECGKALTEFQCHRRATSSLSFLPSPWAPLTWTYTDTKSIPASRIYAEPFVQEKLGGLGAK